MRPPRLIFEPVSRLVLAWRRRQLVRFLGLLPRAQAVQAERLERHLEALRGSAFARDFGLEGVRRLEDLRSALPVSGPERVAPYVERLKAGEKTALFAPETELLMFAMTSGTTAAAKAIPVTRESFREYRRSWTVWGCGVSEAHPRIPRGGVLNLASGWRTARSAAGIPMGSISGLLFHAMHHTMRFTNVIPPEAATVADAEARWYLALRLALRRDDLRMITTANPSTLLSLAKKLEKDGERLLRDLHDGSLAGAERFEPSVRRAAAAYLKPDPRRAAALARLPRLLPKAAWPELELLGVWTGGTLKSYLGHLDEAYGAVPRRDHGLSASEGRMTLPLEDEVEHGVLNVDAAFYEFIREADHGRSADPRTLLAHELTVGERYFLVVTTSGGLVRYDLGDLVLCAGFRGEAPLLSFLSKGAHVASLTGEKLSAFQVVEAAGRALAELGVRIAEYVVAPRLEGTEARYLLHVEAQDLPRDAERLAARLDALLREANVEYDEKRASGRILPLAVLAVPGGAFARLRARRMDKCAENLEQYKHPFLIPDPAEAAALREERLL